MTTAADTRVRRSARYAAMPESRSTGIQGVSARRARMTERLNEERFPNTQDWAFKAGVSPSGRFQVVEEPRKRKKIISPEGIRWDVARVIFLVLGAVMVVVMLVMLASIGKSSSVIHVLDEKISAVEAYNEALSGEVAAQTGDISVCTEAVRLNLISSGGARTIQLTAPEGASLMLNSLETEAAAEATEVPALRAATGD